MNVIIIFTNVGREIHKVNFKYHPKINDSLLIN
mgnify:CR=1 FL=1